MPPRKKKAPSAPAAAPAKAPSASVIKAPDAQVSPYELLIDIVDEVTRLQIRHAPVGSYYVTGCASTSGKVARLAGDVSRSMGLDKKIQTRTLYWLQYTGGHGAKAPVVIDKSLDERIAARAVHPDVLRAIEALAKLGRVIRYADLGPAAAPHFVTEGLVS